MLSLRSKITQAVLGYFMLHVGAKLYVNEIARRLSLDSGNLARKLKELEKVGILRCEERGLERFYSLNPTYPLLKEYKKIILKSIGFEKLLKQTLKQVGGIEQAYLFGSYAGDCMDLASDIDLMVIGRHSTVDLQKRMAKVQKAIERDINIISLGPEEFESKRQKDPFFKSFDSKKQIRIL